MMIGRTNRSACLSLALLVAALTCCTIAAAAAAPSLIASAVDQPWRSSTADDTIPGNLKLMFAVVLARHGDRSPAHQSIAMVPSLMNDDDVPLWRVCSPRASVSLHGNRPFAKVYEATQFGIRDDPSADAGSLCALGQLTMKGQEQLREMGRWLRERYVVQQKLLDQRLNTSQIRAESTDYPRTMDSIQAQLAGMYPIDTENACVLPPGQQIDIHTTEQDLSDLFPNDLLCPRLALLMDHIRSSNDWKAFHESLEEFKEYLMQALKIQEEALFPSWLALYDVFHCRSQHQYPLLPGITEDMVDRLVSIAEFQWSQYLFTLNREYPRLAMQPLVDRIKGMLRAKISQGDSALSGVRMVTMMGHDTTIGPLASFLGLQDCTTFYWPKYASNIILELYELQALEHTANMTKVDQDAAPQFFVHVMYDKESKIIPGCESVMCPWPVFDRVTSFFEDVNSKCRSKSIV